MGTSRYYSASDYRYFASLKKYSVNSSKQMKQLPESKKNPIQGIIVSHLQASYVWRESHMETCTATYSFLVSNIYLSGIGQYYQMPPWRKVNKVFAGKMGLGGYEQISQFTQVPWVQRARAHIKDVMANEQLTKIFPEQRGPAYQPERQFFFNTVEPDYFEVLIKHYLRFNNANPDEKEFWQKELLPSSRVRRACITIIETPGLTHHDLCRSGFKRKKHPLLGTITEIKSGTPNIQPRRCSQDAAITSLKKRLNE